MMGSLNILITAGGTSERIDEVRRITNSGTGRLGAKVADAFADCGIPCHIVYICSDGAARPSGPVDVRIADDACAVEAAVRQACAETAFDVIIHSMAISDYKVRTVNDAEGNEIHDSKISSDREKLIVVLEKAPKIISILRGLAPDAVIVGFKLLAGAGESELVQAGLDLIRKNDCDFVLANDIYTVGSEDKHEGLLIARDGSYESASGKDAISQMIVRYTKQ